MAVVIRHKRDELQKAAVALDIRYVTKGSNEKGPNAKHENISSKSDIWVCFFYFTTRHFAFYAIFDVVDFLVNFVFSRNRKIKS